MNIEQHLQYLLQKKDSEGLLRTLKKTEGLIDFSSNDYLGVIRSGLITQSENFATGSGGSRLLTGNNALAEELEDQIAHFHHAESALIFNSGYTANLGLIASVTSKDDIILYDELIHASVRDALKLTHAASYKFRHNDTDHLESQLKKFSGRIFVIVESLYSMDGDFSPLKEIVWICKKFKAEIIVDEAHTTGWFGPEGRGMVQDQKLEKEIFARVHTFGKALGCHGAAVVGSNTLKKYLINFSRPLIYTTALPPDSLAHIRQIYSLLPEMEMQRNKLKENINLFKACMKNSHDGPIQQFMIPGNEAVRNTSEKLKNNGFDVRPVLSPTVPKGFERLRICLHSFNTKEEIENLCNELKDLR